MALSEEQKKQIRLLYKSNAKDKVTNPKGLSNVKIAEKVGCKETAIRTLVAKEGIIKNELINLVEEKLDTILIGAKIEDAKNENEDNKREILKKTSYLNEDERYFYEESLLTEVQARNLTINAGQALMASLLRQTTKGKKEVMVKEGLGMGATHHRIEEVALNPSDIRDLTAGFNNLLNAGVMTAPSKEEDTDSRITINIIEDK